MAAAGLYLRTVVVVLTTEITKTLSDKQIISATALPLEHQIGNLNGLVIAM